MRFAIARSSFIRLLLLAAVFVLAGCATPQIYYRDVSPPAVSLESTADILLQMLSRIQNRHFRSEAVPRDSRKPFQLSMMSNSRGGTRQWPGAARKLQGTVADAGRHFTRVADASRISRRLARGFISPGADLIFTLDLPPPRAQVHRHLV